MELTDSHYTIAPRKLINVRNSNYVVGNRGFGQEETLASGMQYQYQEL